MKKLITTLITAALIMGAASAGAVDFADTKGHWAEEQINKLVDAGVVDGMSDTEFIPDGEVTRAQYLKLIMDACGMETAEYRSGDCLELKGTEWYAQYLQKALDSGLIPESMIAGYKASVSYELDEDGKATSSRVVYSGAFNGDLPINRQEMAVLTQNVFQYKVTVLTNENVDTENADDFADQSDIDEWAVQSVKMAVANGFIEGTDDNKFNPKDYATRAEAAVVIARVMDKEA